MQAFFLIGLLSCQTVWAWYEVTACCVRTVQKQNTVLSPEISINIKLLKHAYIAGYNDIPTLETFADSIEDITDIKKGFFADIGQEHGKAAQEGYQKALEFIKNKINKNGILVEQDILKIHEMLGSNGEPISTGEGLPELSDNAYVPGKYRDSDLLGLRYFESPKAIRIPLLINKLLDWVREQEEQIIRGDNIKKDEVVALAAKVHYLIGIIHPFRDANGRVARLLTNYMLEKYGVEVAGESRQAYDQSLALDFVHNFGPREGRKNILDLKEMKWEELLKLEAPNFQNFLSVTIGKQKPLTKTGEAADFAKSVFVERRHLINKEIFIDQAI